MDVCEFVVLFFISFRWIVSMQPNASNSIICAFISITVFFCSFTCIYAFYTITYFICTCNALSYFKEKRYINIIIRWLLEERTFMSLKSSIEPRFESHYTDVLIAQWVVIRPQHNLRYKMLYSISHWYTSYTRYTLGRVLRLYCYLKSIHTDICARLCIECVLDLH